MCIFQCGLSCIFSDLTNTDSWISITAKVHCTSRIGEMNERRRISIIMYLLLQAWIGDGSVGLVVAVAIEAPLSSGRVVNGCVRSLWRACIVLHKVRLIVVSCICSSDQN